MKKFVRWVTDKFGLTIVRTKNIEFLHNWDGLDPFFSAIQKLGFAPKHIIDIGANRGNWTRTAVKYFPRAQYTLVEPQDQLKSSIQDLIDRGYKIRWIDAGVSDQSGSLSLNISYRDDSSSFVLDDSNSFAAGAQHVTVAVRTLNEIVSGGPLPEMVKIDAEGFDFKVLAGASDVIGKTDIILVEAMVCAGHYENTVARVMKFMTEAGYRLIDITEPNRSPKFGVLWLCELAFLRNGSHLLDAVTCYE